MFMQIFHSDWDRDFFWRGHAISEFKLSALTPQAVRVSHDVLQQERQPAEVCPVTGNPYSSQEHPEHAVGPQVHRPEARRIREGGAEGQHFCRVNKATTG